MSRPPASLFARPLAALLLVAAPAAAMAQPALVTLPSGLGSDLALLLIYVTAALIFSFMCSVAEAVLLSITPSYIAELRERNAKQAERLHKLKNEGIDRSLAAILTVNTIAHTVGAIGAGSKATAVFGSAWFGVFSGVMTLLILFLSEIVPKTLGAVHWRRLTGPTASYVNLLILTMYPLIWVSEVLTKLISRGQKVHVFSRDEFIAMATVGQQSGQIDERESKIIRNLFRLGALTAEDIMTPRIVMVALQKDVTVAQAYASGDRTPFSRLPLYGRDMDDIVGFVLREDILMAHLKDRDDTPVSEMKRELLTVSGTTPLTGLMDTLMKRRQHIAVVIGEFGETRGLVTLEDLVETLLGEEIVDEGDRVEDMQVMARQLWQKRAKAIGIVLDAPPEQGNGAGPARGANRPGSPPLER
jgi:CBS domain containing-hemolysin-like protein